MLISCVPFVQPFLVHNRLWHRRNVLKNTAWGRKAILNNYRPDPFLSLLPTGALAKFVCTAARGTTPCVLVPLQALSLSSIELRKGTAFRWAQTALCCSALWLYCLSNQLSVCLAKSNTAPTTTTRQPRVATLARTRKPPSTYDLCDCTRDLPWPGLRQLPAPPPPPHAASSRNHPAP